MPPLRIAVNTLYEDPFRPTGAHTWNMHVIRELARIDRDNEYLLLVSNANRGFYRVAAPNFRQVNCLFSNERRLLRILAEQALVPLVERAHRADVLFAPGNTAPLLSAARVVLHIKTMHHRTAAEGMGTARAAFRDVMIRLSGRKAVRIVANSRSNARDICAHLNVPPEKIRLIPEGLDHSLFRPMDDKAEVARRLSAWGIRGPFILFVSGLWRYKNVETLLHAHARLVRDGAVPHDLVIVGRGYRGYERFLHDLVRELGLERRVQFMGHVAYDETPLFYNGADVLALPSRYETFGRTTTEAMACGTPVVAANASSIPEVMGDAGALVEPMDAGGMAEAIGRILQDGEWRAELIRRGLARAREFSWAKNAEALHGVLIEAAAAPLDERGRAHAGAG